MAVVSRQLPVKASGHESRMMPEGAVWGRTYSQELSPRALGIPYLVVRLLRGLIPRNTSLHKNDINEDS